MMPERITDKLPAISTEKRSMDMSLENVATSCDLACYNLNTSLQRLAVLLQSGEDAQPVRYQSALGQLWTLRHVLDLVEKTLEERLMNQEQEEDHEQDI